MHTVHNVAGDDDGFTSSPAVFFVANKIIHGSLGAAEQMNWLIEGSENGNVIQQSLLWCSALFLPV